jgi:hypothetical protein
MAAPKGFRPPAAGKGRVKGTPNKITIEVKALILNAAAQLQKGENNLTAWAEANPTQFYCQVLPKIIPKDLQVSGDGITIILKAPEVKEGK